MIENVIIMGAAGRDFHNFNVYFRGNRRYRVIGFTATQIPDIDGRRYPGSWPGIFTRMVSPSIPMTAWAT